MIPAIGDQLDDHQGYAADQQNSSNQMTPPEDRGLETARLGEMSNSVRRPAPEPLCQSLEMIDVLNLPGPRDT